MLPPVKKFISNTGVRIYRIPCQVFDSLSARVYLLLGAGEPTLVDVGSGLGTSTADIIAGLEAVHSKFGEPFGIGDIRRIIISHGHPDHIGGLPELLDRTKAEVAVHPLDRVAVVLHREHAVVANRLLGDFLRQSGVDPARRADLLQLAHLRGREFGDIAVERLLSDGQDIDGLRIIHTPGHSPGHICIAVGDVLLSADHILAQTVPQQWPESTAPYTGLGHYLDSLDKIDRMPGFSLTLAAHEQAIHDVYERIETIRGAHRRRLGRLLAMLKKVSQPLSINEITHHLYPEATGFRAVLAITDVGARVEYLYQQGALSICNLDEIENQEHAIFRYGVV